MLRRLKEKDAELMLEWMNDKELNQFFRFQNKKTSKKKVLEYIKEAQNFEKNQHYAIIDEKDEYMGTISLKNINYEDGNAEYAISLRKKYIGTGTGKKATKEILNIAFKELKLEKVYLNVLKNNVRAIKFYEKLGFKYEGTSLRHIKINNNYVDLEWYAIFKEEF